MVIMWKFNFFVLPGHLLCSFYSMYFCISNLPSVQSLLAEDHPNLILINRYAMQVFLQRKYLQIHVTSILQVNFTGGSLAEVFDEYYMYLLFATEQIFFFRPTF